MTHVYRYRVFYLWVYRAAGSARKSLSQSLACLAVMPLLFFGTGSQAMDFSLKARLDFDHASYREDTSSLDDGWLTRRARVGVEGAHGNWEFEVEYDFTSDGAFKDAYVSYTGWGVADFSIGQFKTPSGLEGQMGSSVIPFIEQSLPTDAFASSRRLGLGLARNRDNYSVSAMAFGSDISADDKGTGVGARATFLPLFEQDRQLVHLGGWVSYADAEDSIKLSASPEARPADKKLLKTGQIKKVDAVTRAGLEAAWQRGPLSIQSEWMHLYVRRHSGKPNVTLGGGYVAASWVVTGESRRYGDGRFKSIKPERSSGAWELAARLSYVDLNEYDVAGGRGDNLTLGVNWYITDSMRVMFNYIDVHSRRRGKSDDPEIVLIRLQIAL